MITINSETCKKCRLCENVCPNKIFEKKEDGQIGVIASREHLCIACGQCMAVCETRSVKIDVLEYDRDVFETSGNAIDYEKLFDFFATRRSVRNFKNQPVPDEMIKKIIESIEFAPFGAEHNRVEVTVVNNRPMIEKIVQHVSDFLDKIPGYLKNPIISRIIRKQKGLDTYLTLKHHLLPRITIGHYKLNGKDHISRNAPCLLVFHAPVEAQEHTHNALIYVTYAMLAAHSLGLGSTIVGLIPPAINKVKELKSLMKIPEKNEAIISLIIGYPKIQYRRGIRHIKTNINWLQ